MYSDIKKIIVTTDNSFELFLRQLEGYPFDIKNSYLDSVKNRLEDDEFVEEVLTKVIEDQVDIDGDWSRFDESLDLVSITDKFSALEASTNKWLTRKRHEISLIVDYISKHRNYLDSDLVRYQHIDSKAEDFNKSEAVKYQHIKLTHVEDKHELIAILHKTLYPRNINVSLKEFEDHFDENKEPTKIQWSGYYAELKFLIDWLSYEMNGVMMDDKQNLLIINHFVKRSGEAFESKSLSSLIGTPAYNNARKPPKKPKKKASNFGERFLLMKQELSKYILTHTAP